MRAHRIAGDQRRRSRTALIVAAATAIVLAVIGAVPTGAAAATEQPSQAPVLAAPDGEGVSGSYIVVLDNAADGTQAADVSTTLETMAGNDGAQITQRYRSTLVGFAARQLSEHAVAVLRASPAVAYIQEDVIMRSQAEQANPPWGLDRIDQADRPLDGLYRYERSGDGVTVYVVDTGLRASHQELAGRVAGGQSFIGGNSDDCDGHGTHVAGTVAATTWGVAKSAEVYGLRVLDCNGDGALSDVIAALDWVAANANGPSVVNMSLGGSKTPVMDRALADVRNAGITVVVAAGNDDRNACTHSPADNPNVITVASTDPTDTRSWFSNWGSCVDLFAPGSDIQSLGIGSDTATAVYSGTSMASPHVAGVAALHLEANPGASPSQVTAAILDAAATGKVGGLAGSPNLLLQAPLGGSPPPPPPPPPPTPTVSVDPLTVTETERNQTVQVTFRLDAEAKETTLVRFSTSPGSATRNQDYNRRTGTITFAAGQTTKTANLVIRGDTTAEPTEHFGVILTRPTGLLLGDDGVVTIEDNDQGNRAGATVSVISASVTEADRNQAMVVTFQLDTAVATTTRVRYMTAAGSAERNVDYNHRAGTITFRPGETTKTAKVIIRGDQLAEPEESFSIVLSAPVGLQPGESGIITIVDND